MSAGRSTHATVLWRRIDAPGHDWARFQTSAESLRIEGIALFAHDASPVRLAYAVACDSDRRTRRARVHGSIQDRAIDLEIVRSGAEWTLDGVRQPQVEGAFDVDLAFTPATNTLPVRRLALAIGASAGVRAAWLRFPELDLVPLDQSYARTSGRTYRYESNGGSFVRDLELDDDGLVVRYPGLWERVATQRPH